MSPGRSSAWHPFDPEEFAQRNHIPIFSMDFDRLMGCFVRMRREDGGPDRVGIGLREDLVEDPSMIRERRGTLLHELGHWATTTGLLLPVAGFQETAEQLSSGAYLRSSRAEEAADRWSMRQALGIDQLKPKADGGIGGMPRLFQEMLAEFGSIGDAELVEASSRLLLPLKLVTHWARRCEQLGLMAGSNWGWRQTRLPWDD